jgi:transcriptional regulator with XRE-family HTH domain
MVMHKIIKRLRLVNNLTQQAIGEKLNISQNAYSLIENGKTKIDAQRICQFAEIFNINSSELLIDIPRNIEKGIQPKVGLTDSQFKQDNTEELLYILKEQLNIKDKQIEQLIFQLEHIRDTHKFYNALKTNAKE